MKYPMTVTTAVAERKTAHLNVRCPLNASGNAQVTFCFAERAHH